MWSVAASEGRGGKSRKTSKYRSAHGTLALKEVLLKRVERFSSVDQKHAPINRPRQGTVYINEYRQMAAAVRLHSKSIGIAHSRARWLQVLV